MDTATAQKILQNYGMPITPQNMNRVMQEAPNEQALLGRSMGLKGGESESGYDDSILKSQLSKLAGETTPASKNSDAAVVNPAPNTPAPVANVSKTYPSKLNSPRGAAPNTEPPPGTGPREYTGSANVTPPTSGYETPPDVSATGPGDSNIPWWLAALIPAYRGLTAGNPAVPRPQLTGPTANPALPAPPDNLRLPAPAPQLPGPDGPSFPGGAPNNTADMPARPSGPMSVAPEGVIPPNTDANASRVRKEPVRPTFTPQEELTQALMNFRKMFRK